MSAAIPLPRIYEDLPKSPINIISPAQHDNGEVDYDEAQPMTKAEREEMAELKEMVHQLAIAAKVQGPQVQVLPAQAPAIPKWWMASLATITLLGAGVNFIGNSGMWLAKKDVEAQHQAEKITKLEDTVETLRTWNEKLRNNMSAYGWLIDIDGSVSRIEQKSTRRK